MERKETNIHIFMRKWHGNIGYFLAGLIFIYSISGLVLIYRDTDFLKYDKEYTKQLDAGLNAKEVEESLKLKGFKFISETDQLVEFESGSYNIKSGMATYYKKELPSWLSKLTSLHKSDSKKTAHYFTTVFGFLMIFLVVSSFWMYRSDTKVFKKAMYLVLGGIIFTIFLVML